MTKEIEEVQVNRFNKSNDKYERSSAAQFPLMVPVTPRYENGETIFKESANKVACKNYINEFIFYRAIGTLRAYYPKVSDNHLSLDVGFYLLYRFDSKETRDTVIKNFKLITNLEKSVGIEDLSTISKVKGNDCDVIIFMGSKWSYSNLFASLHIQSIRILIHKTPKRKLITHLKHLLDTTPKENYTRDLRYFKSFVDNKLSFEELLLNSDKIIRPNNRYSGSNDISINEQNERAEWYIDLILFEKTINNKLKRTDKRVKLHTNYVHDFVGIHRFGTVVKELMYLSKTQLKNPNSDLISEYSNKCGFLWAYDYVMWKKGLNE